MALSYTGKNGRPFKLPPSHRNRVISECLEKKESMSFIDRELFNAVEAGDGCRIKKLLAAGAGVFASDSEGNTALINAVASEETGEIIRLLIKAKSDINAANKYSLTPLAYAASAGNTRLVRSLIKAGADVDKKYFEGPLNDLNKIYSNRNMIRRRDLMVLPGEKPGITLLINAVKKGMLGIVREFLNAGCSVNTEDEAGYTALMHAAETVNPVRIGRSKEGAEEKFDKNGKLEGVVIWEKFVYRPGLKKKYLTIIRELLDAGADPEKRCNRGKTAVELTRDSDVKEMLGTA